MSSAQDTPLASIQATLDRHIALTQGYLPNHLPAAIPRFDASPSPFTPRGPITDYAKHISSLGFPAPLASDVTAAVAQESQQYQAFVEQVRLRLLTELSTSSVTPNASTIPSLVEAACNVFQNQLINSGLEAIQKVTLEAPADGAESDGQSVSDSDSGSSAGSDNDDGDEELFDQAEEDDNAPMKPGEDVPPLETKYLPIFEALHERGKVLTKPEKTYLVNMTGMTYRQITIWFQNRRRGELKETMNMAASYSKASSNHSDESSEFSDQELEKTLGRRPPNTAFDIRSWRLESAMATKDGSIPPPSPFKYNFPSTADAPNTESDDTDLSDDSDDDLRIPPGLQAPSLTTSITTVDSSCASASVFKDSVSQPPVTTGSMSFASKETGYPRPIKSFPSRLGSPLTFPQQPQHNSLNAQNPAHQRQSADVAHPAPQYVFSNENGLTVNLDTASQLQSSTLRSSPVSASLAPRKALVPGPPSISPSPPSTSAGSPQRQPSPTMSTSPRPNIKPLPRRTGCAPRPRPPPRSGPSTSAPTPVTAPGSSRPSVVLPPSSNPSLGSTTLGALLRPNPPAPAVPQEIEERLTAMAGRMGVGANTGSSSSARQGISSNALRGGAPGSRQVSHQELGRYLIKQLRA
ncbi:unnamed protein product [Rhizoctonia solani]|uniref:Homeobox domain-containing protein n=1 Tax=Rhizoctonia solani TaxID=456999 RepID=A0A8H3CGX9_9AGAM|nr:unnamed protein product [Rhizoctonia solani]